MSRTKSASLMNILKHLLYKSISSFEIYRINELNCIHTFILTVSDRAPTELMVRYHYYISNNNAHSCVTRAEHWLDIMLIINHKVFCHWYQLTPTSILNLTCTKQTLTQTSNTDLRDDIKCGRTRFNLGSQCVLQLNKNRIPLTQQSHRWMSWECS